MGRGGVDLVRRAIADVAVQNDQRRPALRSSGRSRAHPRSLQIVGIANAQHIPPIGKKTRRDVLGEGDLGVAFDGDVVVVVDPAQIVELKMAGERGGLRADAFHQAAVAADRIDVVIEDVEARLVVAVGQPLSRNGHADAGRHALAERAGRRFDARDPVIFRMPRRFAAELAEMSDVVERDRRAHRRVRTPRSRPACGSERARTTAASRRGRSTARSGRDWARSGSADRSAGPRSRSCRPAAPAPSACRDDRSSPAGRRRSTACGSY